MFNKYLVIFLTCYFSNKQTKKIEKLSSTFIRKIGMDNKTKKMYARRKFTLDPDVWKSRKFFFSFIGWINGKILSNYSHTFQGFLPENSSQIINGICSLNAHLLHFYMCKLYVYYI